MIVEMSANDAQTAYLANHVVASDLWTQYQAKSVRRTVLSQSADVMESSAPASADDTTRRRIANARSEAARMASEPGRDGMEQLSERAHDRERDRDRELRSYEAYERSVRGLQIAIVLTGLFMVTRLNWLLICGFVLGGAAAAYGLLAGLSLI